MKIRFLTLLTVLALTGSMQANERTVRVKADYYLEKFYQRKYVERYEAKPQGYESSGDRTNKPIKNAFDNDWVNVWQSDSYDTEQSITVTFGATESISKIAYGLQDRNPYPTGIGYPQTIKVYTSDEESGEDFEYNFSLKSEWSTEKVMFVFPKAVECKRMKLVFEDIFSTNGNEACAEAAELKFLKNDPIFDHVMRMFADDDMPSLTEEYRNDAMLDSLERTIGEHMAKTFLTEKIQRAKGILKGEITSASFPYPVKVYQKTGPDNERCVLTFFADKYTIFEKENYFAGVERDIEKVFTFEPFKSMRDKFNIYLVFTPSNESKYNYGYSTIDSHFETHITGTLDGGVSRLCMFTQNGWDKANKIFDEFKEKYLDEGATIHSANFVMNTASYGGSGQTFSNGIRGVLYTVGGGTEVLIHEMGHSVGDLGDEYCYPQSIKANLTTETDGNKSKWSEFIGFRHIRHVALCDGQYKPSAFCGMEILGRDFCEVCKLALFERINNAVSDKEDWYMADPIVYYKYDEYYPSELTEPNVFYGNEHKLKFRTVVKNLTEQEETLVADFKITSADGSVVRCHCTQEHAVGASQLKSITATTTETVSGLVEGDKIVAKITNKRTGEVMYDYATYKKQYGYVRTQFLLGNADTQTEEEVAPSSTISYPAGKVVNAKAPEINGYIYQRSVDDNEITVQKDVTTEVKHYYAKSRGKVTLTLLDENNNVLETIERYVAYGETFKPTQYDFTNWQEHSLLLPTDTVAYNGVDDIELTYKLMSEGAILALLIQEAEELYNTVKATDGISVGYYTNESVSILNEAINKAKTIEATPEAINTLQTAIEDLELIMPQEDKFYVISSALPETDARSGHKIYVNNRGEMQFQDATTTSAHIFQFIPSTDDNFLLYSVGRGTYLNSVLADNGGQQTATASTITEAKAVCIENMGKENYVSLTPVGGAMLYAETESSIVVGKDSEAYSEAFSWIISEAESTEVSHTLAVGDSGWTTLYLPFNAIVPDKVSLYTVSNHTADRAMLEKFDGKILPKYTPILVNATPSSTAEFKFSSEEADAVANNKLRGTTLDKNITDNAYVLSYKDNKAGFYKASLIQDTFKNNAFKAYLPVDPDVFGKARFIFFDFGTETAIEGIQGGENNANDTTYDLTGRQVNGENKGLYIKNGKKVVK